MLYRYLNSKKGFTMMEILIVVIIMGILVAVAVPVFGAGLKIQKQNECSNHRTIISTAFSQVMYGMIDNGKKQETVVLADGTKRYALDIGKATNKITYPKASDVGDDEDIGVKDNAYVDKACFVLCYESGHTGNNIPLVSGVNPFTIGEIRGGYRSGGEDSDYKEGCENEGAYLKKSSMANQYFYTILDNQEIPVCPFADFTDDDTTNDYYYHILWDTTNDKLVVLCSCPECNEAD